jgi:hypothetical protein
VKDIALPGLLLAGAVLLDFLTLRHRPAIFELFYQWWLRLSKANLTMVGERGVRGFSNFVDRVFGPKILSIRSVFQGALFVFGATLAVSSLWNSAAGSVRYPVTTILISAGALIPAIVNFEGARVLIHVLSKRVTFARVVLFGLASFVLAEITVIFGYVSLGLFAASLVKLGYSHQLALADAVPVSGILLVIGLGFMPSFLAVAVLPAVCCILAWTGFVILYLSSRFALLVRHFLADRIEQEWKAPFTSIAVVIAASVTVATWLSNFIDLRQAVLSATNTQTNLGDRAVFYGTRFGTSTIINLSDNKPELAKYYSEWAREFRSFLRKGMPTPTDAEAMLRVHLPNLARQWNSRIDVRGQSEEDK